MSEIDSGGSVYPPSITDKDLGSGLHEQTTARGITRRNWLAGLAMQAMISNNELLEKHERISLKMAGNDPAEAQIQLMINISKASLAQADAVIAEGKK